MKHLIKFMVAIVLGIATLGLSSCGSDDDEPDAKIKVTQSEIQGTWHNASYGTYRHITFNGGNYSYSTMDIASKEIKHRENGTYSISGINVTFTATSGDSQLGDCEIYWETENKSQLHIYPIGTFDKAD